MAIEACRAVVRIPVHFAVIIIHITLIVVFMAIDACELAVVVGAVVAIRTRVPFPFMPSAIDREVLAIVVERRWVPCRFVMALSAIHRELR